jgi:hypothetical protein
MLALLLQLLLHRLWCIYLCHRILDPCVDDPISCTNLLPNSNSNGNPFVNPGLLTSTCTSNSLNSTKEKIVSTLFVYSLIVCKSSCDYCCCCCKCCCKCWKCCGLPMVSIQSSPFGNLMSCSLLTSYFFSLSNLSYGDVIYGTFHLYSLNCPSCGDVIYGIFIVCLATCTTVGITNGSTPPFIIFYALVFMLSCSLFIPES